MTHVNVCTRNLALAAIPSCVSLASGVKPFSHYGNRLVGLLLCSSSFHFAFQISILLHFVKVAMETCLQRVRQNIISCTGNYFQILNTKSVSNKSMN